MTGAPRRKGAVRRSEIPLDVLRALNEGREETITLVEWLAIDMRALLRSILPDVGLAEAQGQFDKSMALLVDAGVTERLRGVGRALFAAIRQHPDRSVVFEALAGHKSDMVRGWAAFVLSADPALTLAQRLEGARRFAADSSGAVRELAWDSFRSYLTVDLIEGLRLLESWVRDPDPNIRRCAVESARPRGVWTAHVEELKNDPSLGLPLLEPVRSDPSRYVQRSVGNWLNDASKSGPEWVRSVCARWTKESPTEEAAWTVNHALRTLRKQQDRQATRA